MKDYIEWIIKRKSEAIERLINNPNMENAGLVKRYKGELSGIKTAINCLKSEVNAETAAELEECEELLRNV